MPTNQLEITSGLVFEQPTTEADGVVANAISRAELH
jgi:hypothetical protein